MLFSWPSYDVLITRLTRDERKEEKKLNEGIESRVVCTYVSSH